MSYDKINKSIRNIPRLRYPRFNNSIHRYLFADEYIYFFGDLEKGLQEALSDHDPDKTFSFFDGKNHILLFAVEGAGNSYDDLSDIKEKLTNDRVETAVEEYVSTLLR